MKTIVAYLKEFAAKIYAIGKLLVPLWAIWEFIKALFSTVLSIVKDWFLEKVALVVQAVKEQAEVLGVDLTPTGEFATFIAKANVVVPLEEAWHYFLLWLGWASFLVGIKWLRNLVPGLK